MGRRSRKLRMDRPDLRERLSSHVYLLGFTWPGGIEDGRGSSGPLAPVQDHGIPWLASTDR
jgi:hypothetical protein